METGRFVINVRQEHFMGVRVHDDSIEIFDDGMVSDIPRELWKMFDITGISCFILEDGNAGSTFCSDGDAVGASGSSGDDDPRGVKRLFDLLETDQFTKLLRSEL
eukprot:1950453-Karenia_brevis.AAC.1